MKTFIDKNIFDLTLRCRRFISWSILRSRDESSLIFLKFKHTKSEKKSHQRFNNKSLVHRMNLMQYNAGIFGRKFFFPPPFNYWIFGRRYSSQITHFATVAYCFKKYLNFCKIYEKLKPSRRFRISWQINANAVKLNSYFYKNSNSLYRFVFFCFMLRKLHWEHDFTC